MDITEKLSLMMKSLKDTRLRRDIKALKCAADIYTFYAWNLCKDIQLSGELKEGSSIDDIIKEKGVKNKKMLECVLDFLVGRHVLKYENNKYVLLKEPIMKDNELKYLQDFYPNSVEWTNILLTKAKDVMTTGNKHFDTGFDHKKFLELWDGIMKESPYSFRKMAIQKFAKTIDDGSDILDLGCGSGVSIEQILSECKKSINIVGIDASEESLNKARLKFEKMLSEVRDGIVKENIKRIRFVRHDLISNFPKEDKKYDVVFMSLLMNHIPEESRESFFRNVSKLLKDNGRVVIYQIINRSKLDRASMWIMQIVPTHQEYPFKEEYIRTLSKVFSNVKYNLDGAIVVAKK